MMLLSTVSVGASIKFAVVFDNKTFGTEKFDAAVLLTATHISKRYWQQWPLLNSL
jgi:hypothetical protein